MASVVQSPDGATEGCSRKGPPGSSSFHPNCASPWALSCSCSPTSKNQPQFFVRFNLHLLRTSLAARCRCPLLASTNTPSPPLSRPDRRASPRRLHPLFVLPSVRRGVWCGFVAPDVVALRASNCITAPSSVRQVLLPSCTVISSRAVLFLVSTLNIDRVLGRHPFSPAPFPTSPERSPDGSDSRSRRRGADPVAVRPNAPPTTNRIAVRTRPPIRILLQGRVLASPPPEQPALDIIPSSPEPARGPGTPTRREQWPPRRPSRARRAGDDGPPAPVQAPPIPHHHQDGTWNLCIHKDNRPGKHGQG